MKLLASIIAGISLMGIASFAGASVQDIKLNTLEGKETSLGEYKGKVVLLVNVASECALTPQYKDLQALLDKYSAKGITVVGVPCKATRCI